MFLCVFSFFLFFSSQEKLQNDNLFYLFLTFFFELLTFFNTDSVGKTSCFVFFGLFLFSVFLSSVFHVVFCLIFLDLLRNMLHFQSVFFTSLFPLFVHPLSICSLFFCLFLFSRFFHLFSLFKLPFFWSFYYLYVLYVKLFVEKIYFCETIFSSFHLKKKLRFLCFLFSWAFFTCFSMFGLFLCLEKMVSRFYNPPFFSSFQLCFSLFSFLMYPKIRMCFLS